MPVPLTSTIEAVGALTHYTGVHNRYMFYANGHKKCPQQFKLASLPASMYGSRYKHRYNI